MENKSTNLLLAMTFIAFSLVTGLLFYQNYQALVDDGTITSTDQSREILGTTKSSKLDITTSLGNIVENPDGCFSVNLIYSISNPGPKKITSSLVLNDLKKTFNDNEFQVTSVSAQNLIINDKFDGVKNKVLLAPNSVIQPGQSGTIYLTVRVCPNTDSETFQNVVNSSGNGDDSDGVYFTITVSNDDAPQIEPTVSIEPEIQPTQEPTEIDEPESQTTNDTGTDNTTTNSESETTNTEEPKSIPDNNEVDDTNNEENEKPKEEILGEENETGETSSFNDISASNSEVLGEYDENVPTSWLLLCCLCLSLLLLLIVLLILFMMKRKRDEEDKKKTNKKTKDAV